MINLEVDFEVDVPIPVIIIEPHQLNLDELERGLTPVVNFKITNHGLIRANNAYISLPADGQHPFLRFHTVSSFLYIKWDILTVHG